jgi:signal transduction histidine kinase/ligand-binding sensor domain-containing protein
MHFPRRPSIPAAFVSFATFAVLVLAFAFCRPARALDPHIGLDDYNHTMWRARDGAPAEIQTMAQTPDGWLWLATPDGLYRYDGERFEHYALPTVGMHRNRIYRLLAQPNGDLWIAYTVGGLSVLRRDGSFEEVDTPSHSAIGPIGGLAIDADGSVWATANPGVFHYLHHAWTPVDVGPSWPSDGNVSMLLDQYQRLWAANRNGVYLLNRHSGKFEQRPSNGAGGSLIQSPDGRLWAAEGGQTRLVDTPAVAKTLPRPPFYAQATSHWAGQFDRDGNLWALNCPVGVCLVAGAGHSDRPVLDASQLATGRLYQPWQLSARSLNTVLEDREGDIWIASQAGLDRFRENKLLPVHVAADASSFSMARDADGNTWTADPYTGILWRLSPDTAPVAERGVYARVIASDRDGALLMAGKRTIERRYRGTVQQIALPPDRTGKTADLTVIGMLDDGKVLWMTAMETGLMGYVDGQWRPRSAFNLPPRIFIASAAGKGQLWLGMDDGAMILYDNGKLTRYDASALGLAAGIFPRTELIVSGDRGTGILKDGRFRALRATDPEVLRNVSGLAVSPNGDHWFNGAKGIVLVRGQDWRDIVADPDRELRYELLDAQEGYPGRAALENRLPTVLDSGDGQLWFRATGGIVRIDTGKLKINGIRPSAEILRVNTPSTSQTALAPLRLPPGSQAFNIDFTAPGLRRPEGMRFQYRLRGVDESWQTAGARRTAFYTNVAPGRYQFAVRAINEDGLAGAGEAVLPLTIAPTVFQTLWFKLLCVAVAAALAYGLYRYRVRRVTADLARTLHVRMDERERIARTLHDTILQSVQAIILRLHALGRDLPAGGATRGALETLLAQADKTVAEGRDQVHELRRAGDADLPALVAASARELADLYPGIAFDLRVSGGPRPLRPEVGEEIGEIAREALRNAFRHSGGDSVTADIAYGRGALTVRIVDNGTGIDAVPAGGERPRHWGIIGMRERATRIGATLDIGGAPGAGTVVRLSLKAG